MKVLNIFALSALSATFAMGMPLPTASTCIDGYYLETGEYCGEWAGATLRKLPLWGE